MNTVFKCSHLLLTLATGENKRLCLLKVRKLILIDGTCQGKQVSEFLFSFKLSNGPGGLFGNLFAAGTGLNLSYACCV